MDIFEDFKSEDVMHFADSSSYCSVGFGGVFEWLILPKSGEDFCKYVTVLNKKKINFKVLGNMTNVIPSDGLMKGIYMTTKFIEERPRVVGNRIVASAGNSLFEVCKIACDNGLGGMEALVGIPASVGGAIVNNAGAFGTEVSDVLESVVVIESNQMKSLAASELGLAYRKSAFKNKKQIILSATFMLHSANKNDIMSAIRECTLRRIQTQPQGRSAGSVFKRHSVGAAGMLIDKCGLKGSTCGGAVISTKHANFIMNNGGATSSDYKTLVNLATSAVKQKFGIELEREVEYLGEVNESNSRLSYPQQIF